MKRLVDQTAKAAEAPACGKAQHQAAFNMILRVYAPDIPTIGSMIKPCGCRRSTPKEGGRDGFFGKIVFFCKAIRPPLHYHASEAQAAAQPRLATMFYEHLADASYFNGSPCWDLLDSCQHQ